MMSWNSYSPRYLVRYQSVSVTWPGTPREAPLHKAEVVGGVLAVECEALLRDFFVELREH